MKSLTLAYFKEQIAKKYGFKDWVDLFNSVTHSGVIHYLEEAAELYAQRRYEDGEELEFLVGHVAGYKEGELKGWNNALYWATKHTRVKWISDDATIDEQSILKGLKQE